MKTQAIACIRASIAAAFALVLLSWTSANAEPKTIEVIIEHFAFVPASIEAAPGDTVVFTNRDITPHTATAADGSWTTKDITRDASEKLIVPASGTYPFICIYHPEMKGQLLVKAAN